MRDCIDERMRDLLPELLHDRLEGELRADLERHLDSCESCAAELELLRSFRSELSRVPVIDPQATHRAVVARLAEASSPRVSGAGVRGIDWRMAAAIALVIGGGYLASIAARDSREGAPSGSADAVAATRPEPALQVAELPVAEGAIDLSLHDLTDTELQSLLERIESFDGLHPEAPISIINLPETE